MNHTELLNYLVKKHNLSSYCELGVQNPANNFNKINLPPGRKIGVDPAYTGNNTQIKKDISDDFFDILLNSQLLKPNTFDLIFIDGLHHADQVKRDFQNSLCCLNDGGFIVMHDTCPDEEIETCVPRGDQKKWFGDVYKFAMTLSTYDDIGFLTYDFDCGCTVVWKEPGKKGLPLNYSMTWETYQSVGKVLLNVVDFEKFPV